MSCAARYSEPIPIAVALVEENHQTREYLAQFLDRSSDVRCVGKYATAEEALRWMPACPPQVALVDINLPGMSGIECVARLAQTLPEVATIMLTACEDPAHIFDSLRAGASGYLLKTPDHIGLVAAIADVCAGGAPMTGCIARAVVRHFRCDKRTPVMDQLTAREQEILKLLAQGHPYKRIAAQLYIAPSTVVTHITHIYRKLGVQSRTEAAAKYFGHS